MSLTFTHAQRTSENVWSTALYVLGTAAVLILSIAMPLRLLPQERSAPRTSITAASAASLTPTVLAHVPGNGNADKIESAEGGRLVSVLDIGQDRGIYVFNTDTGVDVGECAGGPYAISESGRLIVVVVSGGIELCDPLSANPPHFLAKGGAPFTSVALSPSGRLLASGRLDGIVQLWDVATRRLLWTSRAQGFKGHPHAAGDGIWEVAVTDRRQVAALYVKNDRETGESWNIGTGASLEFQLATGLYMRMLSFVRPDKLLISLGHTTWLFDVGGKGSRVGFLPYGTDALAPGGRTVISVGSYVGSRHAGYTPLTIWDLDTGKQVATLKTLPGTAATSVAFTQRGTAILAGTESGKILKWLPRTHNTTKRPKAIT